MVRRSARSPAEALQPPSPRTSRTAGLHPQDDAFVARARLDHVGARVPVTVRAEAVATGLERASPAGARALVRRRRGRPGRRRSPRVGSPSRGSTRRSGPRRRGARPRAGPSSPRRPRAGSRRATARPGAAPRRRTFRRGPSRSSIPAARSRGSSTSRGTRCPPSGTPPSRGTPLLPPVEPGPRRARARAGSRRARGARPSPSRARRAPLRPGTRPSRSPGSVVTKLLLAESPSWASSIRSAVPLSRSPERPSSWSDRSSPWLSSSPSSPLARRFRPPAQKVAPIASRSRERAEAAHRRSVRPWDSCEESRSSTSTARRRRSR